MASIASGETLGDALTAPIRKTTDDPPEGKYLALLPLPPSRCGAPSVRTGRRPKQGRLGNKGPYHAFSTGPFPLGLFHRLTSYDASIGCLLTIVGQAFSPARESPCTRRRIPGGKSVPTGATVAFALAIVPTKRGTSPAGGAEPRTGPVKLAKQTKTRI